MTTTTAQDATKLRRVEASAAAVAACFPALHEFRPHLADAAALVAQVSDVRYCLARVRHASNTAFASTANRCSIDIARFSTGAATSW